MIRTSVLVACSRCRRPAYCYSAPFHDTGIISTRVSSGGWSKPSLTSLPVANTPRAFISSYQELGYYKNDTLIVLGPKKRADAYRIDPQTLAAKPVAMDERLLQEAIAYYQSTFRAFKRGEMKLP